MSITGQPRADALVLLAQVDALLDELNAAPLWPLTNPATLELVAASTRLAAKFASAQLRAVAEVDVRGTATADGAPSTAAWVQGHCRERPGVAKRQVTLARAMRERYTLTAEGLAGGSLSAEHAHVITRHLDGVPEVVDEATMVAAEANLVALAAELNPGDLDLAAKRLVSMLDPDGEKAFAAEEARLYEKRGLHLTRLDDGTWALRARLDSETGQELAVVIDCLSAPKPSTQTGPDPRTAAQRRADGFAHLLALAHASPKLPTAGGERPTVTVLIPYATLIGLAGSAPATYADGTMLSAQTARRLACDAKILPIVLGRDSQPLDLGRTTYTPTASLRKAVLIRDHHRCGTPRCWGTPRHVHHIEHWCHGGPTCLDNATQPKTAPFGWAGARRLDRRLGKRRVVRVARGEDL